MDEGEVIVLSDQHKLIMVSSTRECLFTPDRLMVHVNQNRNARPYIGDGSRVANSNDNGLVLMVPASDLAHLNPQKQRSDTADNAVTKPTQPSIEQKALPFPFIYHMMTELVAIGMDRIAKIDNVFRSISFNVGDQAGRTHLLAVTVTQDYPLSPPRCHTDLPVPMDMSQVKTVQDALHVYEQEVDLYDGLWTEFEDIDAHAHVVEKTVTSRRIALGPHCTMTIELEALNPRAFPTHISFLGSDKATAELDRKLALHSCKWAPSLSVMDNLELVLEAKLSRTNATDLALTEHDLANATSSYECGICLSLYLGEEANQDNTPKFHCPNTKCSQAFHGECIREWLQSVPGTRQGLYLLIGPCPFCEAQLAIESMSAWR
ncbi:hypothetical protein BASA60_005194 [Batrachochytrium salamandrivorans]|nr:hypothetical protein BASA60_005194 [Batrachochytrium salamandrivorans]